MTEKMYTFEIEMRKTGPMEFTTKFDKNYPDLIFDEPPVSGGNDKYPNASRILTAAVANCLSASLTFCLSKTRMEIEDFSLLTKATCYTGRNENNLWRVKKIEVELIPKSENFSENLQKALEKCKDKFANYCVVSQSIKAGIEINFSVK